jgi:hypothetical protein
MEITRNTSRSDISNPVTTSSPKRLAVVWVGRLKRDRYAANVAPPTVKFILSQKQVNAEPSIAFSPPHVPVISANDSSLFGVFQEPSLFPLFYFLGASRLVCPSFLIPIFSMLFVAITTLCSHYLWAFPVPFFFDLMKVLDVGISTQFLTGQYFHSLSSISGLAASADLRPIVHVVDAGVFLFIYTLSGHCENLLDRFGLWLGSFGRDHLSFEPFVF